MANRRKVWKKKLRDLRSKRIGEEKSKKKKSKTFSKIGIPSPDRTRSLYREVVTERYTVPEKFSLIENTEETIEYFNKITQGIKRKIPRANFVIDSLNVKDVTVDALIYLIAIMENMKLNKSMGYIYTGTFPKEKSCELVYKESGFMDYVESKDKRSFLNKTKVRIHSGNNNTPIVIKEICDFVINEFGVEKKDILFISKILVELMSNAYYHAYPDEINEEMHSKWYLYAEHSNNNVRVIFADTGKGIASTVRRKPNEKIRELVTGLKDSELIYEAFQPGNFIRTETKLDHRGNGLPGIKETIDNSPINLFWILSGSGGLCIREIAGQKDLTKHQFQHKIYGTIVVFEFEMGGIINE